MPKGEIKAEWSGHVGKAPERNGNGPLKFAIASGGYTTKAGKEIPTSWWDVVVWGDLQDQALQIGRGQFVTARGRLEQNTWKDKNGLERRSYQMNAQELDFEGVAEAQQVPQSVVTQPSRGQEITDDDIPF